MPIKIFAADSIRISTGNIYVSNQFSDFRIVICRKWKEGKIQEFIFLSAQHFGAT